MSILKPVTFSKIAIFLYFCAFFNFDRKIKLVRNIILPTRTIFQRPNCILKQRFFDKLKGGLFLTHPVAKAGNVKSQQTLSISEQSENSVLRVTLKFE